MFVCERVSAVQILSINLFFQIKIEKNIKRQHKFINIYIYN